MISGYIKAVFSISVRSCLINRSIILRIQKQAIALTDKMAKTQPTQSYGDGSGEHSLYNLYNCDKKPGKLNYP